MKKRLGAMVCVLVLLSMLSVFAVACNKDGFKINFYDGDSIVTSISTKGKEAITLPTDPVKAGYTFEGWFFEKEFINQLLSTTYEKTKLKAEVNVYAKWTANDNTVAFNANGGTGEMASIVAKTDAVVKLTANAFAREGYTFAGWATTATGEVAYADGVDFKMTASGTTLYAVWTINTYTINFNYDGADSDTSVQTMQTTYGATFACPAPTKTDYVFQGWYNGETQITDNLGASIVTLIGENDKVFNLTAKWALQTEGMEFSTDGTTLTKYTGTAQYVVIPDTVTSIGASAFENCNWVKSVIVPNTVTSIGDRAFYGCSGLTSITIPSSVTSIGNYAFYSAGLTSITLPDSLKSIGQGAFYSCVNLTSIAIPANVTTIGGYPFAMCVELNSITVDPKNTKYKGIGNCLVDTTTNKLIAGCKNSVIPTDGSVTIIGERAFEGCYGLKTITLPNTVTSIELNAFFNCKGLTSIIIPSSVKSIGRGAFLRCSELTSITIPSTVTSMGKDIVYDCNKLATINCEAKSQPTGWDAGWNLGCNATVVWGYVAA